MARKSRYREYLNAVRNVKVLSKAPQRRTTHEPILRILTVRGQFWGIGGSPQRATLPTWYK